MVAACAGLVALFGLSILGSPRQQAHQPPAGKAQVNNETQALRVVSFADQGVSGQRQTIQIVVENVSGRPVVEYTFFKGDGTALTTSGATTGWALLPGETDTVKAELKAGESLTLAALLFADGTGQGNAEEIARMKDYREGVEEQYRRALPILNRAKNAPAAAEAKEVSDALSRQLSSLPVPAAGGGSSAGKAAGSHDAKQFIEVQVGAAESGRGGSDIRPEELHSKVNRTLKHVEKSLTRFQEGTAGRRP